MQLFAIIHNSMQLYDWSYYRDRFPHARKNEIECRQKRNDKKFLMLDIGRFVATLHESVM